MGLTSRRRLFSVLSATILLVAPLALPCQASSTVKKIRHHVELDHTRVVLDVTRQVPYRILAVNSPDRIAINLKRVKVAPDVNAMRISNGVVERIRINRLSWGSQIVLDLREPSRWEDFALAKSKGRSDRIVVDVYPARTRRDPPPSKGLAKGTVSGKTNPAGGKSASTRMPQQPQAVAREYVIAIDPGHGGRHPGAIGKYGLVEKHLALDISKRIVREINEREGFRAVLTRTRDTYLDTAHRPRIAQRMGADVFVSIHMNSAPKRRARGTEVFFISPGGAAARASKLLRNKRQAASELGLEGAPSDDLVSLLLDVNQKAMMHRSFLLAEEIDKKFRRKGFPPARGVKQKSLAVLTTIVMPSVLVECGFITNTADAKFLKSIEGREKVAKATAAGIVSYFKRYPPPPSREGKTIVHKVKKGETLWRISKLYGSSVASIQKANGLGRSTALQVGQELLILNRK